MGGPNRTPKGPQMAQNCNFGAIRGCCGGILVRLIMCVMVGHRKLKIEIIKRLAISF